jgi:DNA-binding beta-propeller fold protein YncE
MTFMKYPRIRFISLLLFFYCAVSFPQSKVVLPPTASNFAYPQSVFIDSYSGHIWVTDFDNNRVLRFDVSTLTGIDDLESPSVISDYFLGQNYPNPFNAGTQIIFSTKNSDEVLLEVYNILGQKIITLFNDVATAGTIYSIPFEAKDLPSGIYLYSIRTTMGSEVKKMCLLK